MRSRSLTSLPVTDPEGRLLGRDIEAHLGSGAPFGGGAPVCAAGIVGQPGGYGRRLR